MVNVNNSDIAIHLYISKAENISIETEEKYCTQMSYASYITTQFIAFILISREPTTCILKDYILTIK